MKFNVQFANRQIEKPEIAGDLDETSVNSDKKKGVNDPSSPKKTEGLAGNPIAMIRSASDLLFRSRRDSNDFRIDGSEEKDGDGITSITVVKKD